MPSPGHSPLNGEQLVPRLTGDDEEEEDVPITGLGEKLRQLANDEQFQQKRRVKQKSFHIDALKLIENDRDEAEKDRDGGEDFDGDEFTTPHADDSPRTHKKRVRFLGFHEVLCPPKSRKALDFNPTPLPPPPPPPGFFERQPDCVHPQGLPRPPPPKPTANALPFVPRPPPLMERFSLTVAPHHSGEPKSLSPERAPVTDVPEPIFLTDEGATHINRKAFRLYTKFIDEIAEFVRLQVNVTRKRVEAQERRAMQTKQRASISQRDEELFEGLRFRLNNKDLELDQDLSSLFQASQKARDDIVPLEEHYDALELELGAAEYALAEKFGVLERRYENFFKLHGTSMSTSLAHSSISYESSEPVQTGQNDHQTHESEPQSLMHGAIIGAAVKVGQTPIQVTHESQVTQIRPPSPVQGPRLQRSDGCSEPLEFSQRQVLSIDSMANYNFVDDPQESREQQIVENLRGIGHISGNDDLGSTSEFKSTTVDLQAFSKGLMGAIHQDVYASSLYTESESLLLLGSDGDTQSTLSDYLMKFDSTRDRINRWMLHKLRVSPREVFELQRKVETAVHDIPDWTSRALEMWDKDGIGCGVKYTPGSVSGDDSALFVPAPFPSTSPNSSSHKPKPRAPRKDPFLTI